MGTTLPERRSSVELGAGELPYFGEGFDPPRQGAYGTERPSRGESSDFFVLPVASEPPISRWSCPGGGGGSVEVAVG
jgi:hypothetical protein